MLEYLLKQIGYQIVHSIAGRTRIRVSWLETDVESASKYQRLLEALSYVNAVRLNPLAHSIVIEYNSKQISIAEAEELFIGLMQQVKLTPPIQTTTIETPPEAEPDEPEPVSETSQSAPVQSSVIPEIPSPWDESVSIDETPSTLAPESSLPEPHSTASLAERLKVTSQAITRRRTKADFQIWTQAQDPERIAWYYDAVSRSFHPVTARPDSHKIVESIDETLNEKSKLAKPDLT
ncbi:HMA2 domain-containing protein [Leptolyngbya sp. NIES-2104]|uniref:HMA2 domain-containing protein n=1 Tax=Leptolyngbya sp. NIES-2104 TaxID=1552121 RepID=UPI0006ECB965|nr:hypothetical protein [Leptolyngbya sp. NIES-2104]GAP94837.1 hypothetical protein NIES2104_13540 [Leptolyngbya sp. NIES-2104]